MSYDTYVRMIRRQRGPEGEGEKRRCVSCRTHSRRSAACETCTGLDKSHRHARTTSPSSHQCSPSAGRCQTPLESAYLDSRSSECGTNVPTSLCTTRLSCFGPIATDNTIHHCPKSPRETSKLGDQHTTARSVRLVPALSELSSLPVFSMLSLGLFCPLPSPLLYVLCGRRNPGFPRPRRPTVTIRTLQPLPCPSQRTLPAPSEMKRS